MKVILTALNSSYVHSCLALRYLRSQAEADGLPVQLLEYTINTRNELILRDLVDRQPDVVAFSVYIWNVRPLLELAVSLKKYLPDCKIILGGPEVSFNAAEILRDNQAADFVLPGETTGQLSQLLRALRDNDDYRGVANLCYRMAGGIVMNDCAAVAGSLDCVFPYTDTDFIANNQIIYYESSRGCPYNCSYCLSAAGRGVRYRDTAKVISELQWLIERKPKQIKFVDRTFNACESHYLPIMRWLAGLDTETNFHCEIVAELISDEMLEIVATAPNGRFQFEIGLQSFQPATLRAIHRANNYEVICERLERLQALGKAHLHVDLIAGLPHEGYAEFAQSFDKAYALEADMLQLGFLKLLKGAPISNQLDEHGYCYHDQPPYEVIANKYISAHELLRLKAVEEILELFYNAGRARTALAWLVAQAGSAFKAHEAIADYWREHRLYLQPHKPGKLYALLLAAVTDKFPGHAGHFAQLLKRDIYASGRNALNGRDLWFDTEELREQKDAFFRNPELRVKYCPGFKLDSWRNLRNNFEIGMFNFTGKPEALLFDYRYAVTVITKIDENEFGELCSTTNIQTS